MLLKRQNQDAIPLTEQLKTYGVQVDMGGIGNRITFDNQFLNS
jgi:hypothetical protein